MDDLIANDTVFDLGQVVPFDPTNGSLELNDRVLNGPALIVTFVLSVIVLLTVGGNLLILGAVLANSNLRGPTHILIANLAVADLLLGTLVLPFSATLEVTGKWYFGAIFCDVWAAVDVLCCTASILSLCVISVDRYIGVTRPLNYYSIVTAQRSSLLCVGVWISSLAISIGPLLGWKERDVLADNGDSLVCTVTTQPGYVLFSVIGSFYLPMLIILALYWRIYRAAIKQTKFLESGIKTAKSSRSEITLRVHVGRSSRQRLDNPVAHFNSIKTRSKSNSSVEMVTFTAADARRKHLEKTPSDEPETPPPMVNVQVTNGPAAVDSNHLDRQTPPGSNSRSDSSRGNNTTSPESSERGAQHSRRTFKGLSTANGPSAKLFKFRRQKKAAKTLGIVVGAFLLCWFPFFVILPVKAICSWCLIPEPFFSCCFWLGYCNSCINPFIYASTSREFKRAFSKILCGRHFLPQPSIRGGRT